MIRTVKREPGTEPWVNWVAIDQNGQMHGYLLRPVLGHSQWVVVDCANTRVAIGTPQRVRRWTASLRRVHDP